MQTRLCGVHEVHKGSHRIKTSTGPGDTVKMQTPDKLLIDDVFCISLEQTQFIMISAAAFC